MVGGLLIPGDNLIMANYGSGQKIGVPPLGLLITTPTTTLLLLLALVKFCISFLTIFYLIKEDRLYIYAF
jgi:hypothetical protein